MPDSMQMVAVGADSVSVVVCLRAGKKPQPEPRDSRGMFLVLSFLRYPVLGHTVPSIQGQGRLHLCQTPNLQCHMLGKAGIQGAGAQSLCPGIRGLGSAAH